MRVTTMWTALLSVVVLTGPHLGYGQTYIRERKLFHNTLTLPPASQLQPTASPRPAVPCTECYPASGECGDQCLEICDELCAGAPQLCQNFCSIDPIVTPCLDQCDAALEACVQTCIPQPCATACMPCSGPQDCCGGDPFDYFCLDEGCPADVTLNWCLDGLCQSEEFRCPIQYNP